MCFQFENCLYYIIFSLQAKFQAKGEELASEQISQFSSQLDTFKTKLEEFAMKHKDEIRKNSQFRRHFQEMCATVGVDPLACEFILLLFLCGILSCWFFNFTC